MAAIDPRNVQAAKYGFPYHHLPRTDQGVWYVGRHLHWAFHYLSLLESVVREVEKLAPESVLDFGCGDGRLLSELASRIPASELWGVDVDERALRFAGGFNDQAKVHFARNLDGLGGKRFDVIVASEVLEHIPPEECSQIVSRLDELTCPSGTVVVTVPTHNIKVSRKHYRHFDAKELTTLLGPHFELVSARYTHRAGVRSILIEGMAVNRFFVANWAPWLRLLGTAYRKWAEPARATNGAHLIAVFAKR